MTDGAKEDLKDAIKKVMVDHLTLLGYPNIDSDVIMHELKNMWIKIEEANLKVAGMDYQSFCGHANTIYMLQQIQDSLI